jgi:cytochrome c peroxidase
MKKFIFIGLFVTFLLSCALNFSGNAPTPPLSPLAELGHHLFFDTKLSANNTKSCSSCHAPQFAFTDGYKKSLGLFADVQKHNSPTIINAKFYKTFNWATPETHTFEKQMERPLFGTEILEMGCNKSEDKIPNLLKSEKLYQDLFSKAFPIEKNPFQWENIMQAIAEYERNLTSFNSPYDKDRAGDKNALSESAKRGERLFFSHTLQCMTCHRPPHFTLAAIEDDSSIYANIGLYNVDNQGSYPKRDEGLYEVTHKITDKGKFKIPTLRNLAFTAPYMHDGSVATLKEVLDIYENGGRKINFGDYKGNGKENPYKEERIHGFALSKNEKNDLLAFLLSLSDSSILKNPIFENPFAASAKKAAK